MLKDVFLLYVIAYEEEDRIDYRFDHDFRHEGDEVTGEGYESCAGCHLYHCKKYILAG